MLGLGGGHVFYLIIFLAIVLVIFGPGKLPEVGSGLGNAIQEFKKATTGAADAMKQAGSAVTPPGDLLPVPRPPATPTAMAPPGIAHDPEANPTSPAA